MMMVQLLRASLPYVSVLALGVCVPPVGAQEKPTEVPKLELSGSVSASNPPKLDRRYAVTRGAWSAATVSLFNTSSDNWSALLEGNPGRHLLLYSPDHKKLIDVIGEHATLRIGQKRFDTDIDNVVKHDAELGWAPDSTKYFVTWSESGELGPWHLQVYDVDASGVHEIEDVAEPARKDFEQLVRRWPIDPELDTPELRHVWEGDDYCEPYHVIGGRWLNGSQEILLSVLIRNTSDCRYMSEFNVYRVNAVTGKILQRFSAAEGHRYFGDKYLPLITP